MKTSPALGVRRAAWRAGLAAALCLLAGGVPRVLAHNLTGDPAHPHYDWSVKPPDSVSLSWPGAAGRVVAVNRERTDPRPASAVTRPAQAAAFLAFAPRVAVRWDDAFLYIESNGLPAHGMMTGITAWQQQVPLPQAYAGGNAWRIPRNPAPSRSPVSIKGRFLRGAIALAVNGIPIFNPQNNRGEVSAEIGELDEWGGHCGRADDYHYHAAPFHLQKMLGPNLPIAFALDGYPIYGLTEPDGSLPVKLDGFNGHETAALGYHYHGSTRYPYVNGGFHGEVVEREGQVDPQPRAQSPRPALPPLRGARITGFTAAPGEKSFALQYSVKGKSAAVAYSAAGEGVWNFHFSNADGSTRDETYRGTGGGGSGGGDSGRKGGKRRPGDRAAAPPVEATRTEDAAPQWTAKRTGLFVLRSSAVIDGGALPVEFTGDGASITPPLEWTGAPGGTQCFAVIMHHLDPEGQTKWYWTLYNIPGDVSGLPKNAQGVGVPGNNSVNRRVGYAPPHSKGPGAKTYVLTVYALSAPLQISAPPSEVTRSVLLAALKDVTLDSAELKVVYTRPAGRSGDQQDSPPPRQTPANLNL